MISCLNCFTGTGNLYLYQYGVDTTFKLRGGTSTNSPSDEPKEVMHRAMYMLWHKGFGDYHLVNNNCEDFALYCKTGLIVSSKSVLSGRSGQVNFITNIFRFHPTVIVLRAFDNFGKVVVKVKVEDMPLKR
ncbi:protein LEAD-SENSITIVE 1-like [Rutidosis leptorrhynchoides]|uniref:protein LEAD-SENSITIVE 1-like n=1 Tax=Rutidosis leptorrhynchoides TaxID=125765 RepID=UPI003A9957C7